MGEEEDYIKLERETEYLNINYIDLNGFLRNIKNTEKGILQNMEIAEKGVKEILSQIEMMRRLFYISMNLKIR